MTVTYHRETHHSKCSKCSLLALRHAIKQSRHWSIDWSMKLCWLLTIFQSDAISAHRRTSLVPDKHVPAFRFQSMTPDAGALVWFSCSQGWKWMVHRIITVMSCCSNSYYQTSVKLLATFTFQCTTRAQEHQAAATQDSDFTPDMRPPNRPDLNLVDYRIWTVTQEYVYQKQQGSSHIKLWLLTEWYCISQGRVKTPIRRGG